MSKSDKLEYIVEILHNWRLNIRKTQLIIIAKEILEAIDADPGQGSSDSSNACDD